MVGWVCGGRRVEGRRGEAWLNYKAALRLDPLALRMWKRIVSLGLDRDRLRTEVTS